MLGRCGGIIDLYFSKIEMPNPEEIIYKIGVTLFSGVFSLIEFAYQLFYAVATARPFSQETFNNFAGRLMMVIGILMLFLVTFSLFKMLFDPDSLSKGGKGSGKELAIKIITTIAMLVSINLVFRMAFDFQSVVLVDNVIGKLFATTIVPVEPGVPVDPNDGSAENRSAIEEAGKEMATTILKSFYLPSAVVDSSKPVIVPSDPDETTSPYGKKILQFYEGNSRDDLSPTLYSFREVYERIQKDSANVMGLGDLACANYKDVEFKWVMGCIVGLFVVWALFVYAFAMGLRVIQLAFYQLIAPIPIGMRILPNKQEVYSKWLKDVIQAFAEVFIRLFIIFFSIYLIDLISKTDVTAMWEETNMPSGLVAVLANIIIICGVIAFILKAPKYFEDLFGVGGKGGNFGLGLKSLKESTHDARRLAGGAGSAVASNAAGFVNNWRKSAAANDGALKTLGSAIAGGTSATVGSVKNTLGGQGFASATANATASAAAKKIDRQERKQAMTDAYNETAKQRGKHATVGFGDKVRTRMSQTASNLGMTDAKLASQKTAATNALAAAKDLTRHTETGAAKDIEKLKGRKTAENGALKPEYDAAINNQAADELSHKANQTKFNDAESKLAQEQGNRQVTSNLSTQAITGADNLQKYADTQRDNRNAALEKKNKFVAENSSLASANAQRSESIASMNTELGKVNDQLKTSPKDGALLKRQGELQANIATAQGQSAIAAETIKGNSKVISSLDQQIGTHTSEINAAESAMQQQGNSSGTATASLERTVVAADGTRTQQVQTVNSISSINDQIDQSKQALASTNASITEQQQIQTDSATAIGKANATIQSLGSVSAPTPEQAADLSQAKATVAAETKNHQTATANITALSDERDMHDENINSGKAAATELIGKFSSSDKIKAEVKNLDSSGNAVFANQTMTISESKEYVASQEGKKAQVSSSIEQYKKASQAATETKQVHVNNIESLKEQNEQNTIKFNAATTVEEKQECRVVQESLNTQYIEEQSKLKMAEHQVSKANQAISNLTLEVTGYDENIKQVSYNVEQEKVKMEAEPAFQQLKGEVETTRNNVEGSEKLVEKNKTIIETYTQKEKEITELTKQQKAMTDMAYTKNQATIDNTLTTINRSISVLKDDKKLVGELRQLYGIDLETQDISWQNLTEKKDIKVKDANGVERTEKVNAMDLLTKAVEKIEKNTKTMEERKRKAAEKKAEKKG